MHVKYLQTELLKHLHLQRNRTKTTRRDVFDYDSNSTVELLPPVAGMQFIFKVASRYLSAFILSLRSYRAKVNSHGRSKGENAVHFKGWIQEQAHFLRLEEAEEVEGRPARLKEGRLASI